MADEEATHVEFEKFEKISLKPIKGSKKSKKSWRKHTDVADVEEYLEEVRRDERTGGSVSGKPDEALFFVEKESESTVKRIVKKKIEADDDDDDEEEEEYVPRKKKLSDKLQKEEKLLEKKIGEARAAKVQTIWGQDVMTVTDAYLESTVKKPKVKPNTVGVGKLDIDAVIVPDPGASYNPDYDSHQELLLKAHEEELRKVDEQKKLNKKVKMVSVKELRKQSKLWLKEMSEGLSQKTGESDDDDDGDKSVVTRPVVSSERRKTLQQRRKQSQIKRMNQLRLEQKKKKVRMNDVMRIKSLKKEIAAKMSVSDQNSERKERKSTSERKPKRLSRYKFVESHTAVQLSEELSGSLRRLKPEGSLIKDRFKSLQRRSIIETRNRVLPRRRYKRKDVVKRSYKR